MEQHYKKMRTEPIDFILKYDLSFCHGNVIKYISRHEHKGGKEDLEKAIAYVEYIKKSCRQERYDIDDFVITLYCASNCLSKNAWNAIVYLFQGSLSNCVYSIKEMIKEEYPDEN